MNATPRKRFGQHFLHDRHVVERIVEAIDPRAGDRIVEIGPGEGVLTVPLLEIIDHLDVVEIDRDLARALRERDDWTGRVTVHETDALRFDFAGLAAGSPLRVVGNLPYNISTPLLFHLLDQRACIHDMHFMLQREVVDRIVARPGSGTYGRLSVMIQAHCEAGSLFRVAPGAFRPPPRVESALVRLRPRPTSLVPAEHEQAFAAIVHDAFTARRKTLRNALRRLLSAGQIEAAGIDPAVRAETLPVEAFVSLASQRGH
ncbi:MAG: 16S rRNA (adenine(1518)-N(6)/adenine(1519)-N(6))-dimethyltransferase RsmA [Halofilum sp. (in: g-proteobacteria)]|nr:16S rRNA (adenine(1518)-N(6)/adenine(1519)-N(6))-dimethyltransferase RsmA [Halofilum sp. (in: g-proteobacteria)]